MILRLAFALSCVATMATADTRMCSYDRVQYNGGPLSQANWDVRIETRNSRAKVEVIGSGNYTGRAKERSNGSGEYRFKTPASSEVIALNADGNSRWEIEFNDGASMTYHGRCGQLQKD